MSPLLIESAQNPRFKTLRRLLTGRGIREQEAALASGAKLTTSAPRLGLPAEYGLSWVLPRLVGLGHAADLLLSSRVVLAEEAATMGLVNRVLPPESLMEHTYSYARALATEVSPASKSPVLPITTEDPVQLMLVSNQPVTPDSVTV